MKRFVLLAGFTLCLSAAQAESLRCKGDLVDVGDTKASVMSKCGAPMMKDSFCKPGQTGTPGASCETVEEWTYNPGRGQFLTTLRFEGSKVRSITYGDRVK